MARVSLTDVCKSYVTEDGEPLPVLNHISIQAEEGQFVCILGPSGSGKSTTLDILAGLTEKDAGEVVVDGALQSDELVTGYVFQRPRLLDWRTVRQNLEFVLQAQGAPQAEWDQRIDEHLSLVGLSDFADAFPLTLSGGMQQRTGIARALAVHPDLLLMDEPFSSLDELTARHLRRELVRIWKESGHTVLFVTHDALEAAFLADKVYVVSDRPASVVGELDIDIPRPRRPDDPKVIQAQQRIMEALEGQATEPPT